MVWHGLIWALVALAAGLWSLLCWGLHALLGWDGWRKGLDWEQLPRLELPDWIAEWLGLDWLPLLREWLVSLGPQLQAWLEMLPPLGDWAAALALLVWALGLLAFIGGGALASLALHWMRRPQNPRP